MACVLLAVAAGVSGVLGATAGASASRPSAPRQVRETPHVGSITITWRPPATAGSGPVGGYVVRSEPRGRTCATTSTSCTVHGILDRTPWRFSVTAWSRVGAGAPSAWTTALRSVVVVVVAGQSNATGAESYVVSPSTHRSIFDRHLPADSKVGLSFWGPYYFPAGIPPQPLDYPQINSSEHSVVTFGPEIGLARGLWADGARHLLVEKVVANGTSLAVNWRPHGSLFDILVKRTRTLLAWAASKGWSPSIGGIYWVQGEADSLRATQAAAYRVHLAAFIAAVRSTLPCDRRTPFVLAETTVGPWVRYREHHGGCGKVTCDHLLAYNATVRAAQVAIARSVRDVYISDTAPLPRTSVQLHLSWVGELELGAAFAALSARHLT